MPLVVIAAGSVPMPDEEIALCTMCWEEIHLDDVDWCLNRGCEYAFFGVCFECLVGHVCSFAPDDVRLPPRRQHTSSGATRATPCMPSAADSDEEVTRASEARMTAHRNLANAEASAIEQVEGPRAALVRRTVEAELGHRIAAVRQLTVTA